MVAAAAVRRKIGGVVLGVGVDVGAGEERAGIFARFEGWNWNDGGGYEESL